ncbi:MAG TPA: TatD family hydrolase, partial [Gemmatimonadales bacterium]|nr:TatD family hydrolase [Gemmatimonadales bacterium]
MLIDTHCHLADPAYDPDRAAVLERAWAAGVSQVVVIGESRTSADRALELAAGEPRLVTTAGIHPHDARGWDGATESWLRDRLRDPKVVAVGETGLDYHYDHSPPPDQRRAFESQLAIAREMGRPAVIHAREAD